MLDEPFLANSHERIDETYAESLRYLRKQPSLRSQVSASLWAYHEIGDLIPQTPENFASGHYFPYSESYNELESSYNLVLEGFYRYSYVALRSVVELGTLGIYFEIEGRGHIEVRPWLASSERTPSMKQMLERIMRVDKFGAFDKEFGLKKQLQDLYEGLGLDVHARGYVHSSSGQAKANVNRFQAKSLERYCRLMRSTVECLCTMLLIKYPIGMQPAPLDEKFGLNGPIGGFLQEYQHETIFPMIPKAKLVFLKQQSDEDSSVREAIEYLQSLPDITHEELERQEKNEIRSMRHKE